MPPYIPRIGTYFSGGGIGIASLYYKRLAHPAFGVESDRRVAKLYRLNYKKTRLWVQRVQDTDPDELPDADIIQVSPECKNFSIANIAGAEGAEELSQAQACCRIVAAKMPMYFILENVFEYLNSRSYAKIAATLLTLGYKYNARFVDAADYEVPQNRIRLVLVATREDVPEYEFPERGKISTWYRAIKDLIPELETVELAEYQKKLLADTNRTPPLLVNGNFNSGKYLTVRHITQPSFTITSGTKRMVRVYLESGTYKLNERALLRLMSTPDEYKLSRDSTANYRAIGNGIPSLMLEKIVEPMLEVIKQRHKIAA